MQITSNIQNTAEGIAPTFSQGDKPRGFTLIELLVVIGILAFLAAMPLPALTRVMSKDKQVQCMNNCKQMASAWHQYATDYGWYPPNPDDPGNSIKYYHWCPNAEGASTPDVFNPDLYYDPSYCLVDLYIANNIKLFHCPADLRTGLYSGTQQPSLKGQTISAVRTISASGAVGSTDGYLLVQRRRPRWPHPPCGQWPMVGWTSRRPEWPRCLRHFRQTFSLQRYCAINGVYDRR